MIERDGPLSLSRQCALLGVSRPSQYYRPKGESAEDLALMRRMDGLHMAYPFYGSRQLMRHLRREGVAAGRHRIRRLMRLMGMEATYRRPRTSVASPEHRVFPYLLRGLTISRADHVWCADITYVPVTQGFFYLVAVMDWATRHVLAWRLSNTMDASFCVQALDDALGWRAPEILNTDQGSQFTSEAFADLEMRLAARPCPYHRRSCWRASAATPSAVDTILSMPLASKLGQAEKAPSWDPRDLWVVRCRVLTCPENQNAYFITRVTPIELKSSVSMV